MRLHRLIPLAVLVMAFSSDAMASTPPASPRCVPAQLNRSALLPGTSVAVSPLPGSYDASWQTQISLLGAPLSTIRGLRVSGSQSGSHVGRLRGYSQRDGASFVPSRPFSPGETVTVRGSIGSSAHARPFAYSFVVAYEDNQIYSATAAGGPRDYKEMQHFHSAPSLQPPVIVMSANSPQATQEDVFAAPYSGPGPSGPMIFDAAGNLVWFHPLPANVAATNLQVQQLGSAPVLTWWQGSILVQGFGQGEEIIDNASYRQIGRVHAGNGLKADLHDFHLTAAGTALMTVFNPIACNLSAYGGSAGAAITDGIVQEVDLTTGLVRREWHSLDHVSPSYSYSSDAHSDGQWPYDYFHVNSIDQLAGRSPIGGTTLISSRNTSALYVLNTLTGQVLTSIGGKHSTVHLAGGAATAYQHDATVLANGTISVFDNGGVPRVHPQSRGLILAVDPVHRTDAVVAQYEHPSPVASGSQGSMQVLEGGNVFIGWGEAPYFTEFSPSGQLLFDAHMHGTYQSYRSYRFPWAGEPREAPAIAASAARGGGAMTVYASWNGDTQTASWRVLAGPSARALAPVASGARTGFETAIATPSAAPYVAVQALSATGAVIGTSPIIRG